MLDMLRRIGLRSDHMYGAGFASIGLSLITWAVSKRGERADTDRADRWGIFIGEWAPTFMALGVALRLEEERDLASGTASSAVVDAVKGGNGRATSPAERLTGTS